MPPGRRAERAIPPANAWCAVADAARFGPRTAGFPADRRGRSYDRARVESLRQHVRHGSRTLGRTPAFTATAGLTLGLGAAVLTAFFAIVDAVLLRLVADQDRVVRIWKLDVERGRFPHALTYEEVKAFRAVLLLVVLPACALPARRARRSAIAESEVLKISSPETELLTVPLRGATKLAEVL